MSDEIQPEIQWWVADVCQYGMPKLTDGPHDNREDCENAIYVMNRLGLSPEKKQVICRVEIYPPVAKAHDVNEEALSALNSIGIR